MTQFLSLFKIVCIIALFSTDFFSLGILKSDGNATTETDTILQFQCPLTPVVWNLNSKPPIYKTNMLRKRVGSALFAEGKFIHVYGRVLDSNCVPLTQATVEIWQADSRGHLRYNLPSKSNVLTDLDLYSNTNSFAAVDAKQAISENEKADPNFSGSGSVTTDNLGYYHFYTVIPGGLNNSEPKIFFSIHHRQVPSFETTMYFPQKSPGNKSKKQKSYQTKNLNPGKSYLLIASLEESSGNESKSTKNEDVYRFDIILDTKSKYRGY